MDRRMLMIPATIMAVLLLAGIIALPARADDFDVRWNAAARGLALCWTLATLDGKSQTGMTFPSAVRETCTRLQGVQKQLLQEGDELQKRADEAAAQAGAMSLQR